MIVTNKLTKFSTIKCVLTVYLQITVNFLKWKNNLGQKTKWRKFNQPIRVRGFVVDEFSRANVLFEPLQKFFYSLSKFIWQCTVSQRKKTEIFPKCVLFWYTVAGQKFTAFLSKIFEKSGQFSAGKFLAGQFMARYGIQDWFNHMNHMEFYFSKLNTIFFFWNITIDTKLSDGCQ